ncbi:MAG: Membrane-bound lytic murein transglycosylase D precursor [Syntrophorhabdus sp. PtaU1.Bin002]|nr:MAG: Membrane-bound lytic murein transglycosylase D precursor [Syntrophorhabdus sp. PtaB.Bin006]OPY72451.1 MAG: Membrane-bound lytic murein transglycosylase D precursor [Syntrophorhabdus sp. PtaU1.Bin002]
MTGVQSSGSDVGKKASPGSPGASRRTVPAPRSLLWALALGVIFLFFIGLSSDAQVDNKRGGLLEKRIADLEQEIAILKTMVDFDHTDTLPESLVLCDKKIPLTRDDIRERFEREYFQLLENRGLMTILVKRYLKYAGLINGETQKMALPSDLIYLVVAESYLNPRAVSSANASGLWQFMKETGKREGLQIDDSVDERYNIKRSTRAALSHLKKLYSEFGDWFVVMAAYNAGRGRLKEAIDNQGTRDFLDLYLPEETERYVFRIMAVKEVISNRERYGIRLYEKELYRPVTVSEISIEAVREVPVLTLARYMDLSYKAFRDLNLHLRKYRLPKGMYNINVPYERRDLFLKRVKDSAYIAVR